MKKVWNKRGVGMVTKNFECVENMKNDSNGH